jgi:hypothetical protein
MVELVVLVRLSQDGGQLVCLQADHHLLLPVVTALTLAHWVGQLKQHGAIPAKNNVAGSLAIAHSIAT